MNCYTGWAKKCYFYLCTNFGKCTHHRPLKLRTDKSSQVTQARREPQRGPGKHYRGALSPPPLHSVCLEIETPKAKRGERCPFTIRLEVRWSVVNSHSGVPCTGRSLAYGAEPRPKMDFMHILGQKEAIWNTIFSIFERRRGPLNVAGPCKTFPLPQPSRRA